MPAPAAAPAGAPAAAPSRPPFRVALPAVVKAAPSGDTLVLVKAGPAAGGPPPELRLGLASVRAPVLGRNDGEGGGDEPGGFAAREALRRMCVGKTVVFEVEYEVGAAGKPGGRLMGRVCLEAGGETVAVEMAARGLVKVRRVEAGKEDVGRDYDALCAAEDAAAAGKAGVHGDAAALVGRKIVAGAVDGSAVADACRGTLVDGVVEYVSNGGAMKCYVAGVPGGFGDRVLTLCLSGVQCPAFRREGDEVRPMPYALNAKFLTESRLLHRDVEISVEGCDRNGVLFATIAEKGAQGAYVGEELLRAGYARTVGWSMELSRMGGALRAAERAARDAGAGVWKGFVKKAPADGVLVGRCVEVVSGDMVAVLADGGGGEVRRFCLASVKAARSENVRDRSAVAMGPALEAKEALRKKLIGRTVKVSVAYTREPAEGAVRRDPMVFAVVGREGDAKNADVALPLISDGLVSVVRHRGEEDRSPNYEAYLERERAAVEAQRGVHRAGEPGAAAPMMRINNLTGPDARKRSRDVAPGLLRGNPHPGVVEYVSSASRMRVFLPRQAMLITVGLKAVRTPAPTRKTFAQDGTARVESGEEPHGDEALAFSRAEFMQRDVEVVLAAVDRVGAFLGSVFLVSGKGERTDMSKALLDAGLGYLHESFDVRDAGGAALKVAETAAREGKIGLWKDYKEPEAAGGGAAAGLLSDKPTESMAGTVCEVGFGGRIFVQGADAAGTIQAVEAGLADLKLNAATAPPAGSLKPAEMVAAKFSADGLWYRARVLAKTADGARVRFVDYGNEEAVKAADVRRPAGAGAASFMSRAPAATEVRLADIVVPAADEQCGVDAGECVRDLVFGKTVEVLVRGTDRGAVVGDLLVPVAGTSPASPPASGAASSAASPTGGGGGSASASPSSSPPPAAKASLVEKLLESGLVRLVRKSDRTSKAAFQRLAEFEKKGQATRDGLWTYGDAYESDCDDDEDVRERNASRRGF